MKLKTTLTGAGIVLAPENGAASGTINPGPPPVLDPETGLPLEGVTVTEETPATPAALTADEVEERAYSATQRAIRDAQDAEVAKSEDAQRRQRAPQTPSDPAMAAMEAIDLRTDLYEEAMKVHPDAPQEVRDHIKAELRQFKSPEALRAAKDANLHEVLADAAYGRAMRQGKIPPKVGIQAPRVEPVHSEPEPSLSRGAASEIEELERTLGVKFTPEERRSFARGQI